MVRKTVPFLLKSFTPRLQTRNLAHVFIAVNNKMKCAGCPNMADCVLFLSSKNGRFSIVEGQKSNRLGAP